MAEDIIVLGIFAIAAMILVPLSFRFADYIRFGRTTLFKRIFIILFVLFVIWLIISGIKESYPGVKFI